MDNKMTIWGEVAELMEDLATAHCYCEYTKLEILNAFTREDKNAAYVACAQEGKIKKRSLYLAGYSTASSTARKG